MRIPFGKFAFQPLGNKGGWVDIATQTRIRTSVCQFVLPGPQVVILPFHLFESHYLFVKNVGSPGMESNDVGEQIQQLSWVEIMLLWETCKDYPAALQLNRDFLRGRAEPGTDMKALDGSEDEYSRRSNPHWAKAQSVRELVNVANRLQWRSVDYTKARQPPELVTDVKATLKVKGDDNIVKELEEDSYAKRSISDASAASDRSHRGKHSPLNADFKNVQFTEDVDTTGTVVVSSSSVVPVSRKSGALLQSQISPSVSLHQRRPQQVEDTVSTSSYTSASNSINFAINNTPAPLPVVDGFSRTNPVEASFSVATLSECQTYSGYVTYCCRCVGWMGLSFATLFKTPLRILVILLFALCCVYRIKWVGAHCTLCSVSSVNPVCEVPGFSRLLVLCSVDEMWDMNEAFDVLESYADVATEGEAALALPYAFGSAY